MLQHASGILFDILFDVVLFDDLPDGDEFLLIIIIIQSSRLLKYP